MHSIRKLTRAALIALTLTVTTLLTHSAAVADESAATPDEVVTKVWGAAKVLQTKGASAIPSLNNADGPWVWKDSYVFAFDCRLDRMVAHPMRPDLVGRPIMQVTDNNGKYIFKELCAAATAKNGGWVEYQWTKPGAGQTSRKLSYAVTADLAFSTGIQVAAGVYDETLSLEQLNKMTAEMADPGNYSH
ncbi:cache domain-containing protein [uncultured Amphritea sp.]|uniref:cache domain-containing protein n=1 Tax=uncultured Amphritea sp. TaxID=981605 RepID=UPI00263014F9|nr:cache domain-containing protein [uncultured Amphritea sp.]